MNYLSKLFFALVVMASAFSSCKSLVTAQDVSKQKSKSLKAVAKAEKELVDLANLKEKYSEETVKAQIAALKKQRKTIDKDIKRLQGVEANTTVQATKGVVSNLKTRSKRMDAKILKLESVPKENWQATVEKIKSEMQQLRGQVNEMTKNVESN